MPKIYIFLKTGIKTSYTGTFMVFWVAVLSGILIIEPVRGGANCDPSVSSYNVDLTGAPDSTWFEEGVTLGGTCCPGDQDGNNCVEIVLTLDPNAEGMALNLEGAPGYGSVEIQVDCEAEIYQVGENICVEDTGPHHITLCRSGNPTYDVILESMSEPEVTSDVLITESCQDTLKAEGLAPESIEWSTVDPNDDQYLDYLSCTEGCEETVVQPTDQNPPDSVVYQVCGVRDTGCDQDTLCMDAKIFFASDLEVSYLPEEPVICYEENTIEVTAYGSGGEGGYTYEWSTNESGKTANLPEGEHQVYVYDDTECPPASTDVQVVQVEEETIADAGELLEMCNNDEAVGLNGTTENASDHFWIGNGGNFTPDNSSLEGEYLPTDQEKYSGNFQLQLVAVNPYEQCSNDTSTIDVDVNSPPDPEITGESEVCAYQGGYIYETDEDETHTYLWEIDGGEITSANDGHQISTLWDEPGQGEITLTRTDNTTGCDSTAVFEVTKIDAPLPEINGPQEVCSATEGHVYEAAEDGDYSYEWSVEGGEITSDNTQQSAEISWHEAGNGIVTLTQTQLSTGCDSTIQYEVTIRERPGASITGDHEACAEDVKQYIDEEANGDTGYNWEVNGGTLLTDANEEMAEIEWGQNENGEVILQTFNQDGECPSYDTLTININPNPEPEILGAENVCEFSNREYSVEPFQPNYEVDWSITGGFGNEKINQQNFEANWEEAGTGSIYAEVTDQNTGCTGEYNKEVIIHEGEKPNIQGPMEACATLDRDYIYSVQYMDEFEYNWYVEKGHIRDGHGASSINVDWTEEGTGEVIVERTNTKTGCVESDTFQVVIESEPVTEISGDKNVCVLDRQYTYEADEWPNTIYQWNVEGGQIVEGQGTHEVTIEWEDVDTGFVEMQAQRESACDEIMTMEVTINTYPDGNLELQEYESCPPFSPRIDLPDGVTITEAHWEFSDGQISHRVDPDVAFEEPGNYDIELFAVNDKGCEDTFRYNIEVLPKPNASFETDFQNANEKVFDEEEFEYINTATGGTYFEWYLDDDDTLRTRSDAGFTYVYDDPGTYPVTLIAENQYGCTDTAKNDIKIHSLEWLHVPNAFSPNDDQHNDYFSVIWRNLIEFEVRILNRWGEILYSSDDPDFKWDGKYRGELVPEGVYVYQIKARGWSGERFNDAGSLVIIR